MNDDYEPIVYAEPQMMKRVCLLYLDMLGYKQFIKIHKNDAYTRIDRCYQNAKLFMKKINTLLDLEKIHFKGYSDNLILFTELDGKIEDHLIYHDMILLSALLQETAIVTCNIQFRGAITAGNCLVDDYVYGDAYMEAYELESRIADWGRVMVSEDIVKALRPFDRQLNHRLISENVDNKERYYVDFLGMANNPVIEEDYVHNTELIVDNFILVCQRALHDCEKLDTLGDLIQISKIVHKNEKMLAYISNYCRVNNLGYLLDNKYSENLFFERMSIYNAKFQDATEGTVDEVIDAFQNLMELLPYYRCSIIHVKERLKKHKYLD